MITVTAPLWVGLLIGAAFGVPAALWGIGNPETLIRAARLIDRLLIGCFAFVTAIGAVLLYGMYALGFSMHFSPKPLYIYGVALGGVLFGVGLAISGYLPGTEWIALGEGRRDALYAIPGGFLGAATWTVLYQTPAGQWLVTTANYGDLVVTGNIAHIHPLATFAAAVGYAAVALTLLYFLPRYKGGQHSCIRHLGTCAVDEHDRVFMHDTAEYLAEGAVDPTGARTPGWYQRLTSRDVPAPNFYARTISAVGLAVAVVVVLAIFLHQIFGQSTTYSWLVGKLLWPDYTYSEEVFKTIGWEPFTNVGVLFGALVSALFISRRFTAFRAVVPPSWRNRFGPSSVKRAIGAFGGSFLVLFGARMAGGCTSGHTLSGGVQLALSAWLFTAAMVTAMLITARLLYADANWLTNPGGLTRRSPRSQADCRGGPMKARAALLVGTVLGSFALMTTIGAVMTEDHPQGPLSLGDVLVPGAIPVLLVIAITVACRTPSAQRDAGTGNAPTQDVTSVSSARHSASDESFSQHVSPHTRSRP
ncbi:YeeE/YedE thiosulfate transporter family protein [Mycolicibacterium sp. ND9-15]|uniref:YeeE/YedE thiosulfate transporter family protein n=1 Tax=Mycolicibacterium sp. ND9-15 TaxID=3042320 RepID=UPI002DDC1141|nr:YeeE/YedE thiosulfate transporter family protein [Mycolicibacterium sp. ND9-15]WSE54467.1 YeeE/YedE thiosulfate transporter family protein [Mycolicibacterium sp. ND9-15]